MIKGLPAQSRHQYSLAGPMAGKAVETLQSREQLAPGTCTLTAQELSEQPKSLLWWPRRTMPLTNPAAHCTPVCAHSVDGACHCCQLIV